MSKVFKAFLWIVEGGGDRAFKAFFERKKNIVIFRVTLLSVFLLSAFLTQKKWQIFAEIATLSNLITFPTLNYLTAQKKMDRQRQIEKIDVNRSIKSVYNDHP